MRYPGRGLSLDGTVRLPDAASVSGDDATATRQENGTLWVRPPNTDDDTPGIDVSEDPTAVRSFEAEVMVLNHPTRIRDGYEQVVHLADALPLRVGGEPGAARTRDPGVPKGYGDVGELGLLQSVLCHAHGGLVRISLSFVNNFIVVNNYIVMADTC
jgi:hypothetical protein